MLIAPYDPLWPLEFAAEAARIERACEGLEIQIRIEHIGGTAVPGLSSRPIIDVLAGVPPSASRDEYIGVFRQLGYDHKGAHGVPGRDYFRRGSPRSHHVHLVGWSSDVWRDHLAFRDYLRVHSAAMREYEILKRQLALPHANDSRRYSAHKGPFIRSVLRRARGNGLGSPDD